MSTLSAKNQVTIPVEIIRQAGLSPGDKLDWAIYEGQITLFKKTAGAAAGLLKGRPIADKSMSDDDSLQSALNVRD